MSYICVIADKKKAASIDRGLGATAGGDVATKAEDSSKERIRQPSDASSQQPSDASSQQKSGAPNSTTRDSTGTTQTAAAGK